MTTAWNSTDSRSPHVRFDEPVSGGWTLRLVDAGFVGVFVIAPFFMGGREPVGQFVLCLLAGWLAITWAVHQFRAQRPTWRFSGAEPLMLLGFALVALQTWPLSQALLEQFSPSLPQVIPLLWGEPQPPLNLEPWQTISLTPYITLSHLAMLGAGLTIFYVLVQRLDSWRDVHHLIVLLCGSAVCMAAFGLLQFATSNGRYFWFYKHVQATTQYTAVGGFTNANHFADFLALTIPLQIWLLLQSLPGSAAHGHSRRTRNHGVSHVETTSLPIPVCLASLAITGLAILLSMSRGGIVITMFGAAVVFSLLWWKGQLTSRLAGIVTTVTVAGLLATTLFGDLAEKMIAQNVVELSSSDLSQLDRGDTRQRIWMANLEGIKQFPLMGTGLGSHVEVYPLWLPYPDNGLVYTHAENGYLQIGLETGLTGLGIVALLWLITLLWSLRTYLRRAAPLEMVGLAAALLAAFLISLVHSITDFVWYAPACTLVVLALGAVASRLCTLSWDAATHHGDPHRDAADDRYIPAWHPVRVAWVITLPATVLLAGWATHLKWQETQAYSELYAYHHISESLDQHLKELEKQPATGQRAIEANATHADESESDDQYTQRLHQRQIRLAMSSVEHSPGDPHAHLRAALAYEKLFLLARQDDPSAMPLIHLQDAARASEFTRAELADWLARPGVLGEGKQTLDQAISQLRDSIRSCPVQGRPYLELAAMVWMEGASQDEEQRLMDQALAVRPYDAHVLFAYGYHTNQRKGLDEALPYFQQGFDYGPEARGELIAALSNALPAAFFLDHFELDRNSLIQLESAYADAPDQYGYQKILDRLARSSVAHALETRGLQAESAWLMAHRCFAKLQDNRRAYHAGLEAIQANPSSFQAHLTLGMWLYEKRVYAEAAEHLVWCHRRKPEVEWLKENAQIAIANSNVDPSRLTSLPGVE
ncbi:MAG: O-antigen ligase family protein [Planctomycetaceae bacterium]|nr:O-antigen ligase family protein [Planctomycetaceae bacterium]